MVNHPACNVYLSRLEEIKKELDAMIIAFHTSKGIAFGSEPNNPQLRTQNFILTISQQKKDAIQSLKQGIDTLEKIKI